MKNYDKDQKLELLDRVHFKKHFQADSWEAYNRQFFNGLAPKYDFLNEILSLGLHKHFKKCMIRKADLQPGQKILDLCTGSGDISLFTASKFPHCTVIGTDVSENMLAIAQQRAAGLKNVTFQFADTLHLPFPDQTFDRTFISFGLRNLSDLKSGIAEMKRVTKPGGCVINLDLGKPHGAVSAFLYKLYFLKLIPWLGKNIFHRNEFNSFQYLPESGKYFPSQKTLVEFFKEAGFQKVRLVDFLFGSVSGQIAWLDSGTN